MFKSTKQNSIKGIQNALLVPELIKTKHYILLALG